MDTPAPRYRAHRRSGRAVAVLAAALLCPPACLGQERSQLCIPGVNPSGHPLFGTPTVRIDRESVDGTSHVARATHAAFGDLNGDGLPDIAAALGAGSAANPRAYLAVCMNLGNGVFSDPVLYTAGAGCCAVEIGDVDRDGWRDLAVANASANTVSILVNNRDGTFAPPIDIPVGSEPRSLKFADFNRDQIPDLAVLNCATSDLSILRGRPGGGFQPEIRITLIGVTQLGGASPFPGPQLAVGDLNGDGAPDIAAPSSPPWMQGISILLNDGSGGFILPPTVVHAPAYSIEIGDLDGDTKPDLAAINSTKLRTLRGRGDGTFDPPVEYGALAEANFGSAATSLSLGDIDGDGALDVAIGAREFVGSTVIFRNRGDGTFLKEELNSDGRPWFVRLLDLGGRGHSLATLSPDSRSPLKVYHNDGRGGLLSYTRSEVGTTFGSPDSQRHMALADLDDDGIQDLAITLTNQPDQVKLCRGLGAGRFELVNAIGFGTSSESTGDGVALADLNGDRRPDLIVADPFWGGNAFLPGKLRILLNTGGFNFGPPAVFELDGVKPTNVVAADLNGDRFPDLALWTIQVHPGNLVTPVERRVQVFINRGDGSFHDPVIYVTSLLPHWAIGSVAAADLDQDGHPELIATVAPRDTPGSIVILHNRGDGTFEMSATVPVAGLPLVVQPHDLNGDGFTDLAVMHLHGGGAVGSLFDPYLTLLFNDGTGRFPTRGEYIDPELITDRDMAIGDFDGNGQPDLAIVDGATRALAVHLNQGGGVFARPVRYAAAGREIRLIEAVLAVDLDSSGRPGLLALVAADDIDYLPNVSCQRCWANCDGSTTEPILNINDFHCFLNRFAARDPAANCDGSTLAPVLTVNDFVCFQTRFAAGCP